MTRSSTDGESRAGQRSWTAVSTPADVQKQLAELRRAGKHTVLMQVKSDQGTHYVAVPLAVS